MKEISLNGDWDLRWYDDERGDRAQRLVDGNAALDRAWKAKVPGNVHGALLEHGVNDGDALEASLQFGVLRLAGGYPVDATCAVRLEANSSAVLAEFRAARWDELGVKTHVAFARLERDGAELARDTMIAPRFHEMKWPAAKVKIKRAKGRSIFTSDTFAWRVCLDLDGERALPDNFFDIYPGIPTVLDWPDELGRPNVLRIGNTI